MSFESWLPRLATITVSVLAVTLGGSAAPPAVAESVVLGVSAHGGGAGDWPENSAKAFRESVAAGYYMVETDLSFTKDLVGVMVHDDKLPSVCSKSGSKVHSLTYAQVQKITCNGEPIPTLSETISILKGSSTRLNLEVKAYSGQSTSSKKTYARLTTQTLVDAGMSGQATMQTFAWEVMLPIIRSVQPDMEVTALESAPSLARVKLAAAAGVSRYAMNVANGNEFLLDFAKVNGMKVGLWSLFTWSDVLFAVDMGVNPISSDHPGATSTFLASSEIEGLASSIQTTDRSAYSIDSATYSTGKVRSSTVMGKAVPSAKIKALHSIVLTIKVTDGPGLGFIDVAPTGSRKGVDGVRVPMPKGTETLTVRVSPGDSGKINIYTTESKAKLSVKVIGYENLTYDASGGPS